MRQLSSISDAAFYLYKIAKAIEWIARARRQMSERGGSNGRDAVMLRMLDECSESLHRPRSKHCSKAFRRTTPLYESWKSVGESSASTDTTMKRKFCFSPPVMDTMSN